VELGALAGAAGGSVAATALYAIARRRVRRLTAQLRAIDTDLERAEAELARLQQAARDR
jgi:hypothetical protein